jgi:thioredoxin-dependent peroxiredoxin
MLDEGTPAPEFTLPDQTGTPRSLSDYRGKWVVLWWFPKAFTGG